MCISHNSSLNPHPFTLLRTLGRRQKRQLLWNQPNPNSFCKIPGVEYPECNYGTPGVGVSPSLMPLCLCGNPDLSPRAKDCKNTETATAFRINTCKSVSKQTTLTSFRINTCEKHRRGAGTRFGQKGELCGYGQFPFCEHASVMGSKASARGCDDSSRRRVLRLSAR
jgi:hypothetical protein